MGFREPQATYEDWCSGNSEGSSIRKRYTDGVFAQLPQGEDAGWSVRPQIGVKLVRRFAIWAALPFISIAYGVQVQLDSSATSLNSINRVAAIPALAFWLLALAAHGSMRRFTSYHLLLIIFVLWNLVSAMWTVELSDTFRVASHYLPIMIGSLMLWDLFRTKKTVRNGLQAIVVGALIAIGGIVMSAISGHARYGNAGGRYSAFSLDPNEIGLIIALALPIAWHLAITAPKKFNVFTCANYCYPLAAVLALILTVSRGALVSMVPGFLFVVFTFHKARRNWQIGFLLLAVVLVVGSIRAGIVERTTRLSSVTESASKDKFTGRAEVWQAGLDIYRRNLVVGVGSGGFRRASAAYNALPKGSSTYGSASYGIVAHNTFLEVLAETGTIGAIIFFSIIFLAFGSSWSHPSGPRIFLLVAAVSWVIGNLSISFESHWSTWLLFTFMVMDRAALPDTPAPAQAAQLQAIEPHLSAQQAPSIS